MKILAKVTVALFAGSACMAQSGDFSCPSTIAEDLCDQLESRSDDELASFYVTFTRAAVDSQRTDPTKDSVPPTSGGSGAPQEYATYTQQLFSIYDLRWPDNTGTRATVPTRIEGTYRLFAAKAAILALGTESFVQEIGRWAPDGPVGIRRPAKIGLEPHSSTLFFNVRGQQLTGSEMRAPSFKIWMHRP